jgi:hypothetical protein
VTDEPLWISQHGLTVGHYYFTNDSDLTLEYIGFAQIRDQHGFRIVMVFRDIDRPQMLLTISETDSNACAGFTPVGDRLLNQIREDE